MKKIISKILIIFIVVIILFEFVFSSNICNASFWDEGEVEEFINGVTNLAGGIVSILLWEKRITAILLGFGIDMLTANVARESGINGDAAFSDLIITPFDIFFNKYKILDVNFFDLDGVDSSTVTYIFRSTVAKWYYVMRLISIIILLVVLIYVGIRMALSTIAEDKAKYKKMLIDWCASLALVFILHYIAIFIIYCNEAIVSALQSGITDLLNNESKLGGVLIDIGIRGALGVGITSIAAVLVFCFIVFQTIGFLIAYLNRMLKVGFLLIISPLISITYSIDKMGDGKAQALGNWLREFTYTILIQPFHCIMYMAFFRPAMSLLIGNSGNVVSDLFFGKGVLGTGEYNQLVNGILAIICLKFINDGEEIVRKIFGFRDDNKMTSMAAGMAVGMMALKNAQKYGKTAKNITSSARNFVTTRGNAFKEDLRSGKIGSGIIARGANKITGGKFNQGLEALKDKIDPIGAQKEGVEQRNNNKKENRFIKGFKKANGAHEKLRTIAKGGGVKGYLAGKYLQHNSLSSTLGMMGAAMAYSSGSTDALTAIGIGSTIQKTSQEYFGSTTNTMASNSGDLNAKADQQDYEKLESDIEELEEDVQKDKGALEQADEYENLVNEGSKAEQYGNDAAAEEEKARKAREDASKLKFGKRKNITNKRKRDQLLHDAEVAERKAKRLREQEEDAKKAKEKATQMNEASGGRLEKISQDREGFETSYNKKIDKQKELKEKKDNFFEKKEIIKRRRERMKPSESELQAKKNEIVQKLRALKIADKAKQNNLPANASITLEAEEEDTIGKTAEALISGIEGKAALLGDDMDLATQSSYVRRKMGLSGADHEEYRSLWKATSEFSNMEVRKEIAKNDSQIYSLGINPETYDAKADGYTAGKSLNTKAAKKWKADQDAQKK